jgi:murein DD-endopeptidase MepM/ murein hydrolase activator NlpD
MNRILRMLLGAGFSLLLVCTGAGRVLAQEPDVQPSVEAWNRCWMARDGLPPDHVRAAQSLLQPTYLVTGYGLRVPNTTARTTFAELGPARVSLEALSRYEIPWWRAKPVDWAEAASTPLSLTHGINACLPYPVRSIGTMPTSIVRGYTLALAIETDRSAACQYTIFGQTEPCYWAGDRDAYVLVGVSALLEPGRYPLRIEVVSDAGQAILSLPLEVRSGQYGFQYIDPPESLRRLMEPELMASEGAFLAQWRTLRSTARHWELPLALPLAQAVPITAPYGDRRSYGGMVDGYHSGVDYGAWGGMEVLAPADGVVAMVETLEMRGNAVLIDHGWGLVTGYWHLSSVDVRVGNRVLRGEPFARVGSTGLSTGPHLHWEVWANGVSVDGRQWLAEDGFRGVAFPPAEPLPVTMGDE